MADTEKKWIGTTALIDCIDQFARDNRNANDVGSRWLVAHIAGVRGIVNQIATGFLNADTREAIDKFRLSEIEGKKAQKLDEIAKLEDEARSIQILSRR